MTAIAAAAPPRTLGEAHRAWRDDVRAAVAAAREPGSGIWERWAAAQYLEREFQPRFERELAAVNARLARLPAEEAARVWAPAELVGLLRSHLVELARMAQGGVSFAATADKLLRALECWCREVEAISADG
jgi:hypothetical protein